MCLYCYNFDLPANLLFADENVPHEDKEQEQEDQGAHIIKKRRAADVKALPMTRARSKLLLENSLKSAKIHLEAFTAHRETPASVKVHQAITKKQKKFTITSECDNGSIKKVRVIAQDSQTYEYFDTFMNDGNAVSLDSQADAVVDIA